MSFIKLTLAETKCTIHVRVDSVYSFVEYHNDDVRKRCTHVYLVPEVEPLEVTESPEEILLRIMHPPYNP